MSYFNFKLFNRPVKNVNTDLEYKKPNKIEKVTASTTVSFSDITNDSLTGVADYKTRVNTIATASFHDFTTWYGPVTNLGTTYQGVYGNSAPPSGNANFSLPLPTLYNHISITYNNPHTGSGSDAVYIFIGGVGSGALPAENPSPGQAVNEITNGTTGASKTYSQIYQAGDYLKIQEKASVITTALVVKLSLLEPGEAPGWAPGYPIKGGRAPILGYRKTVDCSNNCQNEKIYKDNWAKSCARNGEACYNPVIKRIQNNNRKPAKPYNYNTRNLLRSRFSTYEQNAYNFDLSGNLTAWGGGADPANNSYLIHDCSCNAPFTGNNPCIATYKPLNRQFAVNTAVSGRSRIARLKYNTKKRVAATKTIPFGLLGYPKNSCEFCKRDFKPSKGRKGGDNKSRINSRLPYVFGSATPQPQVPPGSFIANMPANRGQSPAVAGYNNKLYVFGGKYSPPAYTTYKTFVVYDTITNSWSSPTPPEMSVTRAWVYGAIWQDKVYIYSGTSNQSAQSHQTMEIYDITNNSFSSVATPDKRTNYAAGAINGKIYICGGYSNLSPAQTNSLIEYDISTGTFTTKTAMSGARQQHAAAVYNNKLYVMGGYGTGTSLIVYDPTLNSWATKANMPAGRYSLKAVTLGSYIYAVGGSVGSLVNTVYRYDPALDTWSTVTPMLTARASFGLGVANNAMYAVGNYNGTTNDGERIL